MDTVMEKNKKFIVRSCFFCLVFITVAVGVLYTAQKKQDSTHVVSGDQADTEGSYRRITYNGKEYRYNNRITTVLYAGIDSVGEIQENEAYASAARADSIALVIMDEKEKQMIVVGISRDTMTSIRRYTISGYDRGTYVSHLGYAYSYGEGGKVSCENLCEAVSELMGGIPVKNYIIMNQSSIPYINELVGGITLEVPNDDVAALHEELTEGALVTLDDSNVSDYLQYRDTSVAYSNEGRSARQQVYVTAYVDTLKEKLKQDDQEILFQLEEIEPYIQTNITANHYLDFANILKSVSFSADNFYQIEGENKEGETHDEFYVDEEALEKLVIDIFYEEL